MTVHPTGKTHSRQLRFSTQNAGSLYIFHEVAVSFRSDFHLASAGVDTHALSLGKPVHLVFGLQQMDKDNVVLVRILPIFTPRSVVSLGAV